MRFYCQRFAPIELKAQHRRQTSREGGPLKADLVTADLHDVVIALLKFIFGIVARPQCPKLWHLEPGRV